MQFYQHDSQNERHARGGGNRAPELFLEELPDHEEKVKQEDVKEEEEEDLMHDFNFDEEEEQSYMPKLLQHFYAVRLPKIDNLPSWCTPRNLCYIMLGFIALWIVFFGGGETTLEPFFCEYGTIHRMPDGTISHECIQCPENAECTR